jgi:hypothetical protein
LTLPFVPGTYQAQVRNRIWGMDSEGTLFFCNV